MSALAARGTAVVTGAAGGIGRAIAARLAGVGYTLALVDRDAAGLAETASLVGGRTTTHVIDLSLPGAAEAVLASVTAAHGDVRLLVNNAGLTVLGPLESQTSDEVERVLVVDLVVVAQLCRVFTPVLVTNAPAHVVNISSFAGGVGFPLQSTYSAAKHGVRGLTHALRLELSDRRVGVSAILPGTIATGLMGRASTHDASLSATLVGLMTSHGAPPSRVADAVWTAVRRNRHEIVVGWDAHLGLFAFRWAPGLVRWGFTWGWRRYRASLGTS